LEFKYFAYLDTLQTRGKGSTI